MKSLYYIRLIGDIKSLQRQTMKKLLLLGLTFSLGFLVIQGCGPSEEELRAKEKARQDSLAQVEAAKQAQIEAERLAQIEADRLAAIEAEKERRRIEFDPNGKYTVQVEASRARETAEKEIPKWKKRGYPDAFVVEFGDEQSGDVWFRVRLGRFATRKMADKAANVIFEDYKKKTWVTTL
ncbi:SPOR domain-containing protein [bacterium]|nr:MAG: SPOR domain-containing protein [bacterium]